VKYLILLVTENQVEQEPKKPVTRSQIDVKPKGLMIDEDKLGSEEQKIISSMLKRATLYQPKNSESNSDSNEDW
jgi:hypothetical protein